MAETLGDAVLSLRTDDAQFQSGVNRAEGRARQLGGTLDKTSGSTSKLAGQMTKAGQSARGMGDGFQKAGANVVRSAGAQRAGMQQLSFQLNDVATMYALGARPMQIFASQSGQVIQAVQMMTGGTSKLAAFLGGPWGMALTGAVVVLTPFIGKLFETEDAVEAVELASDRMGDAQSILGSVVDLTTGKINTQSAALLALARAKAIAGEVEARAELQAATRTINSFEPTSKRYVGGSSIGLRSGLETETDPVGVIVAGFREGRLDTKTATDRLQPLITTAKDDPAMRAMIAIANAGTAREGIGQMQELQAALDGDQDALAGFLNPPKPTRTREGRSGGGGRAQRSGPSQADIEARYEDQLAGVTRQILGARQRTARSAEERAQLQALEVEQSRQLAIEQIETDEHLSEVQKAELVAAENRLADIERNAIDFAQAAELERDAAAMAAERYTAETEALDIELQLADTEAERKAIALKLLAAEEEYLRSKLLAVIFSETANDAERERAEVALAAIRATSGDRRRAVARANETTTERYLRDLNKTPEQIDEAVDRITMRGLDDLNDGLADAIMGVRSLGDVFDNVADQIIAALLRIAIERAIIEPLAGALFPGGAGNGGGGLGGVLSSIGSFFAGFFADGGTIPAGQFGIVGEAGPELVFSTPGGTDVVSNSDSRRMLEGGNGGGTNISMPINIDATGADAAGLQRVRAEIERLRRDLPGQIVTTVQDAGDRRIFSTGNWR